MYSKLISLHAKIIRGILSEANEAIFEFGTLPWARTASFCTRRIRREDAILQENLKIQTKKFNFLTLLPVGVALKSANSEL